MVINSFKALLLFALILLLPVTSHAWWNNSFEERGFIINSSYEGISLITNLSSGYGTVKGVLGESNYLYNDTDETTIPTYAVANTTDYEYCFFDSFYQYVRCPNPPTGLVNYYTFDTTYGFDFIGGNNITGTSLENTNVSGVLNNSWELDGGASYIDTGITMSDGDFTLAIWVNMDSFATDPNARIFDSKPSGQNRGLRSYVSGTGLITTNVYDGTNTATRSTQLTAVNQWELFIITNDGSNISSWLNGTYVGSASLSGTFEGDSANTLFIGRQSAASGDFYDGTIDDFRYWNRALTAKEISYLYNSTNHVLIGAMGAGDSVTQTTSYSNKFYEINNTDYSINVSISNQSGSIANVIIHGVTINGTYQNLTTRTNDTGWRYANYTYNTSTWLPNNNSAIGHSWVYEIQWVNGSNGNITTTNNTQNIYWIVFPSSLSAPNVLEGETTTISTTLTNLLGDSNLLSTVTHSWNGTNSTTSLSGSDYVSQINTTSQASTQTITVISYTNYTLNSNTMFRTLNTTQDVINFNLNQNCGSPNITLINVSIINENNQLPTLADIQLELTTSNGAEIGFEGTGNSNYTLCTDYVNFSDTVDSTINYYNHNLSYRTDFMINVPLNNSTTYMKTLRALNNSEATQIQINFKDSLGQDLEFYPVILEKYNFSQLTYSSVGGTETDFSGLGTFRLEIPAWYRVKVFDFTQGLIYTSDRFNLNQTPFEVTIDLGGGNNYYTTSNGVTYTLQYINSTKTFRADVNTNTLTDLTYYLFATEQNLVNGSSVKCQSSSTSSTATLLCTPSNTTNRVFVVDLIVTRDGSNISLESQYFDFRNFSNYGTDPLLMVWALMLLFVLLTYKVPELSLLMLIIVMWVVDMLNFYQIGVPSLIGFTIFMFIGIIMLRLRSRG